MKRPLFFVGLAIALVVIGGGIVYQSFVAKLSNPDYIVRELEKAMNCRAMVDSVRLQGFRSPTRLEIQGLYLGKRDQYAEEGIPIQDRPAFTPAVAIDYLALELQTGPLLARRMVIKNLILERPHVELQIFRDGTTSLDSIIRPPAKPASEDESPDPAGEEPDQPKSPRIVKASELPVSAIQGRIAIEGLTVLATVERSKTTVQIHDAIAIFSDVDIDPGNLALHNAANLELSAWVGVDSLERNTRYLDLSLDGNGAIQPFNPDTSELDPSLSASVTVRRDSWIDALPIIDDMEELLKQLEDYGVSFEAVRLRGDFSEDTTASFNATRKFVRMTSDFMIPIDENFLILEESSWVNTAENDHEFFVTFIGSERLTRKAESEIDKFLLEKIGEIGAGPIKAALMQNIKQGDFLVLRFNSKGDMGDPNVVAVTPFGEIGNLIDGTGDLDDLKERAEDLLKDLFGR